MQHPAFDWLDPWGPVTDRDTRAGLERQLRVEVSERHVLFGADARLVARRDDTDDVLFALSDGRWAEVHLTWRRSVEPDPRWPATALFASLDDWAERSMRPLHAELFRDR